MASSAGSGRLEEHEVLDLRREALTMALYVAVCLLAAAIAVPDHSQHAHAIGIVWGISIGLVLAHLFAFRVSARLVGGGRLRQEDLRSALAQLLGGAAVAALATLPVVLLPTSQEVPWLERTMAALIGLAGYGVARRVGARRTPSIVYALVIVALAVAVASVKNLLAGH
jgi:hypothetical protein